MQEHLPFGCCMCCRAPLYPDISTVEQPDTHTIYVMQALFAKMDEQTKVRNLFCGPMNMSHIVSRAHVAAALKMFWDWGDNPEIPDFLLTTGFKRDDEPTDARVTGWKAEPRNGTFFVNPRSWSTAGETTVPYHAWWKLAAGVRSGLELREVRTFVLGTAGKVVFQNPECVYPCCFHCNQGMDHFPRVRDFLSFNGAGTPLVPPQAITIVKMLSSGPSVSKYPVNDRVQDRTVLSATIAYYLHRCLKVARLPTAKNPASAMKRCMFVTMSWFCLMVTCACMERVNPTSEDRVRHSDHVYRGRVNLFLGHLMHCMLQYEFGGDVGDFYTFYIFYYMEMWMCAKFWTYKTYAQAGPPAAASSDEDESRRDNDPAAFVWHDANANNTPEVLLKQVSKRIVLLYTDHVRPLGLLILGQNKPANVAQDTWDFMKKYFVTKEQADELAETHRNVRRFSDVQKDQAIAPFILNFGVKATLQPFVRGLSREQEYFADCVNRWVVWHMNMEGERLASQYSTIGPTRGRSMHCLQHFYDIESRLQHDNLTAVDAAMNFPPSAVFQRFLNYDLCSLWKAVCRLRKLKFHEVGNHPTRHLLKSMGVEEKPEMQIKIGDP